MNLGALISDKLDPETTLKSSPGGYRMLIHLRSMGSGRQSLSS